MAQGLRVSLLAPELPGQELGGIPPSDTHTAENMHPAPRNVWAAASLGGSSKEPPAEVLAASLCWWKAGATSLKVVAVVVAVWLYTFLASVKNHCVHCTSEQQDEHRYDSWYRYAGRKIPRVEKSHLCYKAILAKRNWCQLSANKNVW